MKILHLEDNPLDAEMMQPIFESEWPGCAVRHAASRDEFAVELARGGHDVILSDFNLISFTGLDALKMAQERCPSVPFIFLSGTIGEDRAVEAMRQGASDYVIKDRPKRLIPAMRRALDAAKEKRVRRAAEENLLRVQRLESIGMLAAGIAHDFNNVLAPVLMAVPLLRESNQNPMQKQILNSVEKSVERGAGLVKEILGFAHGVTGEPQLLQPKHLVRDLLGVMRSTFPAAIKIEETLENGLWAVTANPTQLHQVLLNLCVNARDAMPGGGTLTVRVANRALDETAAAAIAGLQPGPHVLFEVTDTGTGIPPEIVQNIWEPFFTTKAPGKGTGLGLATVRSIVESHRGGITLHTRPAHGTTFQVLLPASPNRSVAEASPSTLAALQGHNELVLVVDDDPNIRELTAAILTRHGYRVIAAADGAEAVSLFGPRALEVRAVVTDLSMPILDGHMLGKILRRMNAGVRILAITGLAEQHDRFLREGGGPCLMKPFSVEALLQGMHELLAQAAPVAEVVDA